MQKCAFFKNINNHYFACRHAESEANLQKIILSDPTKGCASYGLTHEGREQITTAVKHCALFDKSLLIYSSDFLRAKQTAEIVANYLNIKNINISINLRERYFGSLEGLSNANYQKVWEKDIVNPAHKEFAVESVLEVAKRLTTLINELEAEYKKQEILLVSHGDTLQILRLLFLAEPLNNLLKYSHLGNAEILRLY
jgi:probable phosphoglycerate mutase